jgi:hypothetical protein
MCAFTGVALYVDVDVAHLILAFSFENFRVNSDPRNFFLGEISVVLSFE